MNICANCEYGTRHDQRLCPGCQRAAENEFVDIALDRQKDTDA